MNLSDYVDVGRQGYPKMYGVHVVVAVWVTNLIFRRDDERVAELTCDKIRTCAEK